MSRLLDALSLRAKILALAALLLAFAATIGVTAIRSLSVVERTGTSMYADRVVPLRSLGEVRALLGDIDSQIQRAITDRDAANQAAYAKRVDHAREAFDRIGLSVDDMTGRVEAIAAAVAQIAAGAEKVQHDMVEVAAVAEQSSASTEQVSASTQETSASAQEIAASAEQLAGTAEGLQRLVGRFTLA